HQTDSTSTGHIQKSGCFHAGTIIEFALDAEFQTTAPAHHRASTDKRNRLISRAFENHIAVFETRDALQISFVTARSIRSFHSRRSLEALRRAFTNAALARENQINAL